MVGSVAPCQAKHTLFPLYAAAALTICLQLNTKRKIFPDKYLANIYLTHTVFCNPLVNGGKM